MTEIVVLAFLFLIVAWLTAAGMAVRTLSRIWLRHWVERRLSGSAAAELYLERPQRLLLTAATMGAIAVFLGGAIIASVATVPPEVLALRVAIAALVVLLFGQLVPRAIARRWATRLAPALLLPLRVADLLVRPVLRAANLLASRLTGRRMVENGESGRDDLEELLREGELEGVGRRDEIAIITGVVHFGEKVVAEVMTPRDDIFALDEAIPPEDLARRVAQSAYSRVPIYRGSIDDVRGMLHAFDVIKSDASERPPLRHVAMTTPTRPCRELLVEMLRGRTHLAMVRDESGHTMGLVTLEDLLEELVGDIRDEHDEPQAPASAPSAKSA